MANECIVGVGRWFFRTPYIDSIYLDNTNGQERRLSLCRDYKYLLVDVLDRDMLENNIREIE